MLDFIKKQKDLYLHFKEKETSLGESNIEVKKIILSSDENNEFFDDHYLIEDKNINENKTFSLPIFYPKGGKHFSKCILLLHGLNERNWDKYLMWAEYLSSKTNRPVVLFPIAFHINRGLLEWSNPRKMITLVNKRGKKEAKAIQSTFVNAALSERISEDPLRFYNSGRQTINDIVKLVKFIHKGKIDLLNEDCHIDIFSYSIGSFLSEILLLSNPLNLFSKSKLFMFCGGSIFQKMDGASKFIMDSDAYAKLYNFYCNDWVNSTFYKNKCDKIAKSFSSMIRKDYFEKERMAFFNKESYRIAGISLVKDTVIPYSGVKECMGEKLTSNRFTLLDFPYDYRHENPFPYDGSVDVNLLKKSFNQVFSKAVNFLS